MQTSIAYLDDAVYLTDMSLWLDSCTPKPRGFISHAHTDHTADHQEAICSMATAAFLPARKIHPVSIHALPFGDTRHLYGADVTLYPSGHICGSAQLLVSTPQERVLYSGDIKLRPGRAAEAIVIPQADTLIMETTFGSPAYAFPERDMVVEEMATWCRRILDRGETPVVMGYSLGKAQEIVACLASHGFSLHLHRTAFDLTAIAQAHGIEFPPHTKWCPGNLVAGVLICAPHLRDWIAVKVPRSRFAVVTGWEAEEACDRYGAEVAFHLSDHADFHDLLTYVRKVAPQRVYTLHGFAETFAEELNQRGYQAFPLTGDGDQD